MSETTTSNEKQLQQQQQQQRPIQIDELPAPLRKLYAKSMQELENNKRRSISSRRLILNEPLMGGFALLRAAQLLNIDVYYIGLESRSCRLSGGQSCWSKGDDCEAMARRDVSVVRTCDSPSSAAAAAAAANVIQEIESEEDCYRTILDDFASYNPLQKYIDRSEFLRVGCKLAKIFLSLTAIMIGFNEMLSTFVLCLMTIETKLETSSESSHSNSNSNSSMGLFVLVLVQFSSIYILFSTIFNGHLIWNLFSQRQFLISRRFQYKTMLKLLVFIYLEYVIQIAFVSNLYDWDFTSNNIESGSYSVLANLRILVTFKDFDHFYVDILMTILAFARGIIRISPYITINYAIICLKEHINTIRNQRLLTDSLKKRQKLRLVVGKTSQRRRNVAGESKVMGSLVSGAGNNRAKKRVNFVTEPVDFLSTTSGRVLATSSETSFGGGGGGNSTDSSAARRQTLGAVSYPLQTINPQNSILSAADQQQNHANGQTNSLQKLTQSISDQENPFSTTKNGLDQQQNKQVNGSIGNNNRSPISGRDVGGGGGGKRNSKDLFLERIEDFDELESYITNMYIFTGKLNRFMSSQGLTVFFIVHNLVISVSLIIPDAIKGGVVMVQFIRLLLILIAILPFIVGQSLSAQLEQLSKQIDRIIIQQHFIHRRRDNLVRIRELIHDIKVNCGGMLNFNVATGIKYLVVAFASAFFIEQERKYRSIRCT